MKRRDFLGPSAAVTGASLMSGFDLNKLWAQNNPGNSRLRRRIPRTSGVDKAVERMHTHNFLLVAFVLFAAVSATAQDASTKVIPIPQQPFAEPVPEFIGASAFPNPVPALPVPQSPFMAENGRSELHVDAYQSDTYFSSGPLGHSPEVNSTFLAAECGTVTFDKQGRILVVCVGVVQPILYLLDPVSLETLARFPLPRQGGGNNFGSGGYFYLDELDRSVIPTRTRDIFRIKEVNVPGGTTLMTDHTCANDLPQMIPDDQSILSVLPDAQGLLWFTTSGGTDVSAEPAMVGTAQPDPSNINHCAVRLYTLPSGEAIVKSFAVDPDPSRGGVFIVSDHRLYRFDAAADGSPLLTWAEQYDRGVRVKPGQITQGSGTTPTLMGTEFVTIADNADPRMHVNVYRRAAQTNQSRLVCSEPVFKPLRSDTFNSLIATNRSISVENNYGYRDPLSTAFGGVTQPGITRIDLDDDLDSCHTVWTNKERVPNVVSQVSLVTGLEYTYTKDHGPDATDAWYFTAIDFHTGETVYKVLAGTGILYNSNYSSVYVGPDGKTAYVGVIGGLVRIHDTY
ncbi:MAG TPA: hypothetical protein VGM27_17550 [Acidobacteriaceae bacterium]